MEQAVKTIAAMRCPQCGAHTPDDEWNCVSCRMNVYWASRHYEALAAIRAQQGLPEAAPTPPFLIRVHERAMTERAGRGGRVEHRVRQIARRAMGMEPQP
ncbi:MAG TPA: hypothetical protein VFL87_07345 [Thermoleophilaceae bacterium]|nr:hypothetical protein [Thermoleophilaceae bacterium]